MWHKNTIFPKRVIQPKNPIENKRVIGAKKSKSQKRVTKLKKTIYEKRTPVKAGVLFIIILNNLILL